jgi:hypothetical protein
MASDVDPEGFADSRIRFLNTDVDLGNTFVEVAKTELKLNHCERCEALLQKATVALDTVRRLMLKPPPMATEDAVQLAKRCDELECSIRGVR